MSGKSATLTEVRQALETAIDVAEGSIRDAYEGTSNLVDQLEALIGPKLVLSALREKSETYLKPPEFYHGQPIRNKRHCHPETLKFCCLWPDNELWAIVIREDGRLSEMPVESLEKVE